VKKLKESGKALLGKRIRSLRNMKGWTQQELGSFAQFNYKFIGEMERGLQNPSFNILNKIAGALDVELLELFRFEQEISDRNEIEARIDKILQTLPDESIRQIFMMLLALYPIY
jgi:transcriptional regulator with XRE-family HTH domain